MYVMKLVALTVATRQEPTKWRQGNQQNGQPFFVFFCFFFFLSSLLFLFIRTIGQWPSQIPVFKILRTSALTSPENRNSKPTLAFPNGKIDISL